VQELRVKLLGVLALVSHDGVAPSLGRALPIATSAVLAGPSAAPL
jgi:hypothetical protein